MPSRTGNLNFLFWAPRAKSQRPPGSKKKRGSMHCHKKRARDQPFETKKEKPTAGLPLLVKSRGNAGPGRVASKLGGRTATLGRNYGGNSYRTREPHRSQKKVGAEGSASPWQRRPYPVKKKRKTDHHESSSGNGEYAGNPGPKKGKEKLFFSDREPLHALARGAD